MNKKKINKSKSSTRSRKLSKVMKGGNAGRYVLPPAYFGNSTRGYFPDGSSELATSGKQKAVSQGTIWDGGKYAGPNLYPAMTGAGCGCKRKSNKNSTMNKSKSRKSKSSKSRKSKSKA